MGNAFIQLTETDKRVLMSLFLLIFLVFVLIGFIGSIIVRVIKWEGKKLDNMCNDVMVARVINDKKSFVKYAKRKNSQQFFKDAWIGLVIFSMAWLVLLLTCVFRNDFNYNIFDHHKTGFSTLFFLWDFSDCYGTFFGITILNKWPTTLINTPHFSVDAIGSYIFVPAFLTGAIWYLIAVQRFFARSLRIKKLSESIFKKTLDEFNLADEQKKDIQMMMNNQMNNPSQPNVEVIKKDDWNQ